MLTALRRRLAASRRDERGAGLASAVVASTFIFIVIVAIGSSLMAAATSASTTRSSFEASNVAQAGRDSALERLMADRCVPQEADESYGYSYTVYRSAATTAPKSTTEAGVTRGCPSPTDRFVLVEVKGKAGAASEKTLLTTYNWSAAAPANSTSGYLSSAFTSSNGASFTNYTVKREIGTGNIPQVQINSGNFACSGTVLEGTLNLAGGNIANLTNCDSIQGDVQVRGTVGINAAARQVIGGNLCATGSVTAFQASNVAGTVLQNQTSCPRVTTPVWQDYNPSLTNGTGNTVVPLNGEDQFCKNAKSWGLLSSSQRGYTVDYLESLTNPTTIDATRCGSGFELVNVAGPLRLKTNITIVANTFLLQGTQVTSADRNAKLFNLIAPDRVASPANSATCSTGQGTSRVINSELQSGVYGAIYTPCALELTTTRWVGQVQVGSLSTPINNGELVYKPVALKGLTSTSSAPQSTPPVVFQQER